MSIFNLKQDEADLVAWAERELSTEGQKILAGLEAVIETKFDSLGATLETDLIAKFSDTLADKLGVSRDLVTKAITDAFDGKLTSLPGDVVDLLKGEIGKLGIPGL